MGIIRSMIVHSGNINSSKLIVVPGEIPEIRADALQRRSGGLTTAMMKLPSKSMERLAGSVILNL
jgi:hypothetical protein